MDIKSWCWEMTPKENDNIRHLEFNSKVDMISIPIEDNNLSLDEEPHPQVLDTLKSKLDFKGSIRLSASGNSYNLFKNKLDKDNDLVVFRLDEAKPF